MWCVLASVGVVVLVTGASPAAARPDIAEAGTVPPLPQPHPNRASASRKAMTARAAAALAARTPPLADTQKAPASAVAAGPENQSSGTVAPTNPAAATVSAPPAAVDTATPPPERPLEWSATDVEAATRECDELLGTIDAVADLQPPLRLGECGTPAPVKLSRIGSGEGVALEPAGILNCRMAARLHRWIETVAQPAAREMLGTRIVKLTNASAYMCRNRYNDAAAKISEHAYANALDVSAFVLADGRRLDVKTFWGDVRARERALAERAARATPPARQQLTGRAVTSGLEARESAKPAMGVNGSAKPVPAEIRPEAGTEQRFLQRIHDAACGIFTTVLGPEANAAHHDHFHLDLQKRRSSAYCQ